MRVPFFLGHPVYVRRIIPCYNVYYFIHVLIVIYEQKINFSEKAAILLKLGVYNKRGDNIQLSDVYLSGVFLLI